MPTAEDEKPAPPVFTDGLNYTKIPVCRRDAYTISYELFDGHTLIHADFHKPITPQIMRAYRRDADALFEMHGGPVHAITDTPHAGDYRKWVKFVEMFGFQFNFTLTGRDGVSRPWFTRMR